MTTKRKTKKKVTKVKKKEAVDVFLPYQPVNHIQQAQRFEHRNSFLPPADIRQPVENPSQEWFAQQRLMFDIQQKALEQKGALNEELIKLREAQKQKELIQETNQRNKELAREKAKNILTSREYDTTDLVLLGNRLGTNVRGSNKDTMATKLVETLERQDRLDDLLGHRKKVDFMKTFESDEPSSSTPQKIKVIKVSGEPPNTPPPSLPPSLLGQSIFSGTYTSLLSSPSTQPASSPNQPASTQPRYKIPDPEPIITRSKSQQP